VNPKKHVRLDAEHPLVDWVTHFLTDIVRLLMLLTMLGL
jgi:hypothetical protein